MTGGDSNLLDRPVKPLAPEASGPGRSDGYPTTNARGQVMAYAAPPAGSALAERITQIEAEIAADEAAAAAAETAALAAEGTAAGAGALETEAAPVEGGTGPIGWVVGGVALLAVGGVGLYAWHKVSQANAAKEKLQQDKKRLEEEKAKAAQSGGGGNNDNVKITGDPCEMKPYDENDCPKDQDAHHIIMDMVFRYGTRGTEGRIPNAPTLESGETICLSKAEHKKVHDLLREKFKALSSDTANGPKGTAPIKDIVDKSIQALEDVKPECKGQFEDLRKSFQKMENQLGRVSPRPQTPGSAGDTGMRGGTTR